MMRLENTVRDYAWGAPHGIPEILGVEADGTPAAELWIGAHPGAPSHTELGTLDSLIATDPHAALGRASEAAFGPTLPFLLKLLSARTALSIQVHPSRDLAAARFAQEERDGVPVDAPHRNYRDTNHKPELIHALSHFEALCGLRSQAAVRATIDRLRDFAHPADEPLLAQWEQALNGPVHDEALRQAVALLVGNWEAFGALADSLAAAIEQRSESDAPAPPPAPACLEGSAADPAVTLVELNADFPTDPGALVGLMLCRVHLAPGESLFLGAGELHAYLRGLGVEIMAASDNVLRGGLTPKHVDVPEMLRVARFAPRQPQILHPDRRGVIPVPVDDFSLQRIDAAHQAAVSRCGAAIVLCVEGSYDLSVDGGDALILTHGQSAFIPAEAPAVTLTGQGLAFVATTGLCE